MRCQECLSLLSDYIDKQLEENIAREIELHTAACPACHQELEALTGTIQLVKSLPRFSAPGSLAQDISKAIRQKEHRQQKIFASYHGLFALAASLLVVALIWSYAQENSRINNLSTPTMAENNSAENKPMALKNVPAAEKKYPVADPQFSAQEKAFEPQLPPSSKDEKDELAQNELTKEMEARSQATESSKMEFFGEDKQAFGDSRAGQPQKEWADSYSEGSEGALAEADDVSEAEYDDGAKNRKDMPADAKKQDRHPHPDPEKALAATPSPEKRKAEESQKVQKDQATAQRVARAEEAKKMREDKDLSAKKDAKRDEAGAIPGTTPVDGETNKGLAGSKPRESGRDKKSEDPGPYQMAKWYRKISQKVGRETPTIVGYHVLSENSDDKQVIAVLGVVTRNTDPTRKKLEAMFVQPAIRTELLWREKTISGYVWTRSLESSEMFTLLRKLQEEYPIMMGTEFSYPKDRKIQLNVLLLQPMD